jgi:hypothetical protein
MNIQVRVAIISGIFVLCAAILSSPHWFNFFVKKFTESNEPANIEANKNKIKQPDTSDISITTHPVIRPDTNEKQIKTLGQTQWEKTYGGASNDRGDGVQQTSDDGYIVVGSTRSQGAGKEDVYLLRTDSYGNIQWEKTYGGKDSDHGNSIQQTSDGGYIVVGSTWSQGAGQEDVYLLKTDLYGNILWEKTYGGAYNDIGNAVQQTSDGGYIVVGYTNSQGAGWDDVYLIKTNSHGNTEWEKTYGGKDSDHGNSVQQTNEGGYIVFGFKESRHVAGGGKTNMYLIKTDSYGNTTWEKTYGGSSYALGYAIQQTSDGGYIVVGDAESQGTGGYDVYLIKTDSHGNTKWEKTYGGSRGEAGKGVQQTSDGGYIVVGVTTSQGAGQGDVYLLKTDLYGNILWEKTYGGAYDDIGNAVQQTSDGGYIVVGSTISYGAGGEDLYLVKTDSYGNVMK